MAAVTAPKPATRTARLRGTTNGIDRISSPHLSERVGDPFEAAPRERTIPPRRQLDALGAGDVAFEPAPHVARELAILDRDVGLQVLTPRAFVEVVAPDGREKLVDDGRL